MGEKWERKSSQETFHNTRSSEEGETEGVCPEKDDRKTDVVCACVCVCEVRGGGWWVGRLMK